MESLIERFKDKLNIEYKNEIYIISPKTKENQSFLFLYVKKSLIYDLYFVHIDILGTNDTVISYENTFDITILEKYLNDYFLTGQKKEIITTSEKYALFGIKDIININGEYIFDGAFIDRNINYYINYNLSNYYGCFYNDILVVKRNGMFFEIDNKVCNRILYLNIRFNINNMFLMKKYLKLYQKHKVFNIKDIHERIGSISFKLILTNKQFEIIKNYGCSSDAIYKLLKIDHLV